MADASWAAGGKQQRGRGVGGSEHLVRAGSHGATDLEGSPLQVLVAVQAPPKPPRAPRRWGKKSRELESQA